MLGTGNYDTHQLSGTLFYWSKRYFTQLCALISSTVSAGGLHLSASLEESGACIGERIVFTCSVIRAGILQWAVESINEITADPIEFYVTDTPGVITVLV